MADKTKEYQEMLILKGIGAELQNMAYPRISNLKVMLESFGYTINTNFAQTNVK